MRQAARSFRFPDETLAILEFFFGRLAGERNRLDGNETVDLGIARFVDDAHRSPSQLGQDFVSAKVFALGVVRRFRAPFQEFRLVSVSVPRLPSCRRMHS